MTTISDIAQKVHDRQRISTAEAGLLFESASDRQLSELATLVRDRYHLPNQATYLIMSIINYTNVCVAKCDYCAFYKLPGQSGGYLLRFEEVCERIERLMELGGSLISFNGGFHPKLRLQDYADLFQKVRSHYGSLEFFEFTVAEFMFNCKVSKLSYGAGAKILADAGTGWVTGGGAEILDDRFRKRHSPLKYTVEDYYTAQRAILDAGIGSTATMVIGFDESLDERLQHLEGLRQFQDATGKGLVSFLCWTYKPWNTELGGKEISSKEYLRWLAVCRIYLDNFKHIRTSVLTQNDNGLTGLQFGADDFDLPTEDEVTEKAGATISLEFDRLLDKARQAGFTLIQRPPFTKDASQSIQ